MNIVFALLFFVFLKNLLASSDSVTLTLLTLGFSGNPALLLMFCIVIIVRYLNQIDIFFFTRCHTSSCWREDQALQWTRPGGRYDMQHSRITTDKYHRNETFPLIKCIRRCVYNEPLIILILVWRKSIHFWRRCAWKTIN